MSNKMIINVSKLLHVIILSLLKGGQYHFTFRRYPIV